MPRTGIATTTPTRRAPVSLFVTPGDFPTSLTLDSQTQLASWSDGGGPSSVTLDSQTQLLSWQ